MRYLSVCSGIEAASVAWEPLGWKPVGFSEIEPFPCELLAHRFGSNLPGEPLSRNGVPNFGDLTQFREWPDVSIDLLCGGTPCQAFSIAGLRKGLDDPRGNLTLTYLALVERYRPEWLLWENVPGVLSIDRGRAFSAFLTGLGKLGYGWAYRVLDAQYVRVDGHPRAVPQRRRRVFVVGHSSGDPRRAAAVLFEPEGMRGDSPPRREARQGVAPTISSRPAGGGGGGTDFDLDGGLICANSGEVAYFLAASAQQSLDAETETLIAALRGISDYGDGNPSLRAEGGDCGGGSEALVAHALRAEGFDAGEDGTGRGTPLVPICFDETQITSPGNFSVPKAGDPSHPLASGARPPSVAYAIQERAVSENPNAGPDGMGVQEGVAYTLEARSQVQAVSAQWAVRRLTPLECERLQGFPDGWTAINRRNGKPAADGPRYKALGNSMAVNVMRWIGQRIEIARGLK